jgi:hypothetical protein
MDRRLPVGATTASVLIAPLRPGQKCIVYSERASTSVPLGSEEQGRIDSAAANLGISGRELDRSRTERDIGKRICLNECPVNVDYSGFAENDG